MNFSLAVFLVDPDNVRAVSGTYEETGKSCTFKTRDKDIVVGDIVVVPSNTRHNFTTFKITEVDVPVDFDAQHDFKWVVGRVDMTEYKRTLDNEAQIIKVTMSAEQRDRREKLRAAINFDQAEIAKLNALAPPTA